MAEERKDSFAETVNTAASAAHTVKGAIKAGKAISGAAKGAAAGGPYGAVAGAVWAGRKHIGKIIAVASGKGVFVSGCNIASDCDRTAAGFASSVFGYSLATPDASPTGRIGEMEYSHTINPDIYCVENPDGLRTEGRNSGIWMYHPGTHFGAAVYHDSGRYRTIALSVPLETFLSESDRAGILAAALEYLSGEGSCPSGTTR